MGIENQSPLELPWPVPEANEKKKMRGKQIFSHMLFRSSLPEGLVQATGFQAWKNKRAQKELKPRIKRLALS